MKNNTLFKSFFIFSVMCFICLNAHAVVTSFPADEQKAVNAVKEASREKYAKARSLARQSGIPLALKVTEWLYLTNTKTQPPFEELKNFMEKNPQWPRLHVIRKQAEQALLRQDDDSALEKWFEKYPPVSTEAFLKRADILFKRKDWETAVPMLYALWDKGDFSEEESLEIQQRYGVLLHEKDYVARIHRLLHEKKLDEARRLIDFSDDANQRIFRIRLALIENDTNALQYTNLKEKKHDNRLLYDISRWLRRNKRAKEAFSLIEKHEAGKIDASLWWQERSFLINEFLNKENYKKAYFLAKNNYLKDGNDFADAEWLAGWIALRYLNEPEKAIVHFTNMFHAVSAPVSLSRGAYWVARSYEALNKTEQAEKWYEKSAENITTLYGQISAHKIKHKKPLPQPKDTSTHPEIIEKIKSDELFQSAVLLQKANARSEADVFILRLYGTLEKPEETAALSYLLTHELKRIDLAVSLSRRARLKKIPLFRTAYPVIDIQNVVDIEKALVFSIIRQESNFSPYAVSSVGARGLMQIMPATAKHVMRQKKLNPQKLNENPQWNILVGSRYLKQLVEKYDGSYVLATAAYNAGPGNVAKWIKARGIPQENIESLLDWIERIPFDETRNYVMRVMENLYIYRHLLDYPENKLLLWSPTDIPPVQQSVSGDFK